MTGPAHGATEGRGGDIPATARGLPTDDRNTAPQTRARYRYQDECTALAILNHLPSNDLEGVLIEHSTDLILIPSATLPELVSIKHREPNQSGNTSWNMSALKKQRVLIDLYRAWEAATRKCTVAFWTSSGFSGTGLRIWKVCALGEQPSEDLLTALSRHLGVARNDARMFLAALKIPVDPLPRRKEITDIGVRRTADVLIEHRPDGYLYADKAYDMLVDRIARAGTELPQRENAGMQAAATLAMVSSARQKIALMQQFIATGQIVNELLRVHDKCSALALPEAGHYGWEPDSQFIGRVNNLSALRELLRPGEPVEISPVVIHGIPGCGKTSLAAQFAALHRDSFRPIFINASSRTTLIQELAILAGHGDTAVWETGIADNRGPVTPQLPWNSATLLVLDGVTAAENVRGIVPRQALCRIIITSTISHIDQAYRQIELLQWKRSESHEFIRTVLPEANEEERDGLASALSDHPLALTQAVNYCRVTHQEINEYLSKLAREPLSILARGEASGHLDSVVKTIQINIELAQAREPVAADLLGLLAHMGSSPVNLTLFERELHLAFVNRPMRDRAKRWATLGRIQKRKAKDFSTLKCNYYTTRQAANIRDVLKQEELRDRAIETLTFMSLARKSGNALSVHPLVALVVRQLIADPVPWLEVAFGLFVPEMMSGSAREYNTLDSHLDHLISLSINSLDSQLQGPAVLAACHFLTWRLALIGVSDTQWGGRWTAVQFGRKAVSLAENGSSEGWATLNYVLDARRALGQALFVAGHKDEAINSLEQNIELLSKTKNAVRLLDALLDMANIAADFPDRKYARDAFSRLNYASQGVELTTNRKVRVTCMKARLLRRLGRIDEAKSMIDIALNLKETGSDVAPPLLEDTYNVAALLARDIGSTPMALEYELAALEIREMRKGERPDSRYLDALTNAADGAIEAGELTHADELLAKAQGLACDQFGAGSEVHARVLAVRGRLRLHQGMRREALADLRQACNTFRKKSGVARPELPAPLVHLAQVAHSLGYDDEAWRSIREAYEIDLELYGPDHPETRKDLTIIDGMKFMNLIGGYSEPEGLSE